MAPEAEVGVKDRVFEANMNEPESRELPLPDVKDSSMSDFLPDNDIFTAPEQEEVEQPQQQVPEKRYKNPDARARIVENEKRDLEIKIDRLTEVVNQYMAQGAYDTQPDAEPEEEIDPEINPVGFITRQIEDLRNEIRSKEYSEQNKLQMSAYEKAVNAANLRIQAGLQEAPQLFQGAIMHLAKVVDKNLSKKYPNLTSTERLAVANDQISTMKARWVAQGLDPAREMLDMAETYGWEPSAQAPSAPQAARSQDKRGQVRAQKDRASSVATIGGVAGSSPKRVSAKELKSMDMKTFNHTINEMIRSGEALPSRTIGKTPSFSDLLPGKGVSTR